MPHKLERAINARYPRGDEWSVPNQSTLGLRECHNHLLLFSPCLTVFSSRIESHSVTALGFKVKEMARFDASCMRSISVAWKDFVDRSAMSSSPHFSVTIDNRADSTLIILANKRKYSFSSMP